jgi:protein TonB
MLLLPTFSATLMPCPLGLAEFSAHEKGLFCSRCQRVVQDFSHSENPLADLATARAASPDGRVCGSFSRQQAVAPLTLSWRLKWFLVALVLVVGQGLTAQQALAQVRRPPIDYTELVAKPEKERLGDAKRDSLTSSTEAPMPFLGMVVEQVPVFRGGSMSSLSKYIQKQLKWPAKASKADVGGRLFISFTVGEDGLVRNATVIKGLSPLFDDEALRVVKGLTGFEPAKQNGKPVSMSITIPVTFKLK